MNVIRYNPNRWFDFPFDRVFDEIWGRAGSQVAAPAAATEAWAPRVDIREGKDSVLLTAELPGVAKDGVSVELENGVLTISGEKKAETLENENGFYRSERIYGAFKRSFQVPDAVDAEHIAADYADGVLTLTLPKHPEAAPRQISISGESGVKKLKAN